MNEYECDKSRRYRKVLAGFFYPNVGTIKYFV